MLKIPRNALSATAVAPTAAREETPYLTEDEARAYFDASARRQLKMSGDEFVSKWRSGFFYSHPEMMCLAEDLAVLIPLAYR